MFSCEPQLIRVCRALCARARLDVLWTDKGPTTQVMELVERDGGFLSYGERLVLLVAWSLWSGCCHVTVAEVFFNLDGTSLTMLGKLMIAAGQGGGEAIEAWRAEAEKMIQRQQSGHA